MNATTRDLERFWAQVDVRGDDECWMWTGTLTGHGYGRFRVGGREIGAHRFMAMSVLLDWNPELHTLHHCDNRPCVNPAHLYMGTAKDNVRDCVERDRHRNGYTQATHCIHGHPFDEENTRITTRGYRECRACARDRAAADRNDPAKHAQRLAYWRVYRMKRAAS